MYVSLTSQLEKPWNFLSLSDLHALRICHYSTKSGFYHLKVFASYIKTLHSMSIFLRFSAINRLPYSLTHMNCPSNLSIQSSPAKVDNLIEICKRHFQSWD